MPDDHDDTVLDTVPNNVSDDCSLMANMNQMDTDRDGMDDACDADDDNDNVSDGDETGMHCRLLSGCDDDFSPIPSFTIIKGRTAGCCRTATGIMCRMEMI